MITLSLGVVDIPYVEREAPAKQRARVGKNRHTPKASRADTMTTGDVAEILEEKYHVMEIFYEQCQSEIAAALETSLAGTMESILQGAPGNGPPPYAEAESAIKARFDQFITMKEMEALGYPGVPTKAAVDGVSHRFKHPYAKRAARPSFVDTGLYLASFVAEVVD